MLERIMRGRIKLPMGWEDKQRMPEYFGAQGSELFRDNSPGERYVLYQKGIWPWFENLIATFGERTLSPDDYRDLSGEELRRRIRHGVVYINMGWIVQPNWEVEPITDFHGIQKYYLSSEENSAEYRAGPISILPLMQTAHDQHQTITLSEIVNTASGVKVHPNGLILTPGATVNVYSIECIQSPPHYIFHLATTTELARFGPQHSTSSVIKGDWQGLLLLEITNSGDQPVLLEVGSLIAQCYPIHNPDSVGYKGSASRQFPDVVPLDLFRT